MAADEPTILATTGGWRPGSRTALEFGPLVHFAVELSGATGRRPKLCHIGTANGDHRETNAQVSEAGQHAGIEVTHLNLFPRPHTDDLLALLEEQDVVWVNGGSVVNLLAVWRAHCLDDALRRAWLAGVVLGGISAGSICWHVGGPTDSFGPELRLAGGLGFLPYGNGAHYDSQPQRRPTVHRAVAAGLLPTTHCTDEGAGLLYRGTKLTEAIAELPSAGVYRVHRDPVSGEAVEDALSVRRL